MPAVRVLYISVAARELLTALECVGVANFTDLGTRYSLPKDWDTISIVYNAGTLNATGGNPKILDEWKRNPPDGGDIVQVIGKLTLDRRERQERARSGLRLVEGQGVLPLHGHRGCYGQSCWSLVAASTGWRFMDKPLGTACHIDDQHPIDTMTGLTSMSLEKGWVVPEEQAVSLQAEPVFNAGTRPSSSRARGRSAGSPATPNSSSASAACQPGRNRVFASSTDWPIRFGPGPWTGTRLGSGSRTSSAARGPSSRRFRRQMRKRSEPGPRRV